MQQHASTYSVLKQTLDPCGGVKGEFFFFLIVVMLHIKLDVNEHRAPCKHIFTQPQPLGWGQRSKHLFFLKVVMLHIKLKGMEPRAPCKHIFCPYTHHQPVGWIF